MLSTILQLIRKSYRLESNLEPDILYSRLIDSQLEPGWGRKSVQAN